MPTTRREKWLERWVMIALIVIALGAIGWGAHYVSPHNLLVIEEPLGPNVYLLHIENGSGYYRSLDSEADRIALNAHLLEKGGEVIGKYDHNRLLIRRPTKTP